MMGNKVEGDGNCLVCDKPMPGRYDVCTSRMFKDVYRIAEYDLPGK
jgi:hypothetical protein